MMWWPLTDDRQYAITVEQTAKNKFQIQAVKREKPDEISLGENEQVWSDAQYNPFWASAKTREKTLAAIVENVPGFKPQRLTEIENEVVAAIKNGDISWGENVLEICEITDKNITDTILFRHDFYCDPTDPNQTLYLWAGNHWDSNGAESVVLNEMATMFEDEAIRKTMVVSRTLDFIKGISMNRKVVPKPPEKIAFLNGVLDVRTLELAPHDLLYFYIHVIPVNWNPNAECPKWIEFLKDVTIDQTDRDFLQEWCGYALYEEYPEPGFLIIVGPGQNGKTVYAIVIANVIGEDNITATDLATLTYSEYGKAQLYHKLADICDEMGSTEIKNAGPLKEVSSGSRINCRMIYGKPFDFTTYAKPTYACNEPPAIHDTSDAMKFRLKAIEFPYLFVKKPDMSKGERQARDRQEYVAELLTEREGIARWMVMGLKRFLDNKARFTTSKSIEATWLFYERKSKPVAAFIEECLEFTDDDSDVISKDAMYQLFKAWLEASKIKTSIKRNPFFKRMKDQDVEATQSRAHDMKRMYLGVRFKEGCNKVTSKTPYPSPIQSNIYDIGILGKATNEEPTNPCYIVTEPQPTVTPSQPTETQAGTLEPSQADIIKYLSELASGAQPTKAHIEATLGVSRSRLQAAIDHLKQRGAPILDRGVTIEVL